MGVDCAKQRRRTKQKSTGLSNAISQGFPLIEVFPNHCKGWSVAQSKAETYEEGMDSFIRFHSNLPLMVFFLPHSTECQIKNEMMHDSEET